MTKYLKTGFFLLILMLVFAGCEKTAYKINLEQGEAALSNQNYNEAIDRFTKMLDEKPADRKASERLAAARKANEQLISMKRQIQEAKEIEQNKAYATVMDNLKTIVSLNAQGPEDRKVINEAKNVQQELIAIIQKEEHEINQNLNEASKAIEEKKYNEAVALLNLNAAKDKVSEQAVKWMEQSSKLLAETETMRRESLVGEWGSVPRASKGYHFLKIQHADGNKMKLEMISTQSPPHSRIAEIKVDAIYEEGKITFQYDNDGWNNRGKGSIQYKSADEIDVVVEETYSNPSAYWSLGSNGAWPRITTEEKLRVAKEEADAQKKAEQERIEQEKKRLARFIQKRGTLTFIITDVQYSAPLKLSQLSYEVMNDASAKEMSFGAWIVEFYDQNDKLIAKSHGAAGTNAIMPGKSISNILHVNGDVRNYSSFKLTPVAEGGYPIVDPFKFER